MQAHARCVLSGQCLYALTDSFCLCNCACLHNLSPNVLFNINTVYVVLHIFQHNVLLHIVFVDNMSKLAYPPQRLSAPIQLFTTGFVKPTRNFLTLLFRCTSVLGFPEDFSAIEVFYCIILLCV